MKDKDKFRIPKIKLGEVFEVDGNLYVITIRKDAAQSSNLSNNRNIYELKLM
jgi:hypothetical protein